MMQLMASMVDDRAQIAMRSYLRNHFLNLVWLTVVLGAWVPGVSQAVPTCANPCVTQIYAGGGDPARTINIAYVSWGWPDVAASTYSSYVQTSMGFMSISPFTLYSTYFNIYRVDINSSLSDTTSAIKALALQQPQLPNITTWSFVVNDLGRSYAFYGDIYLSSRIDAWAIPLVTVHELGHAIGQLADEYTESPPYPAVWTFGEPGEVNVTINTDRATLKWKNWLGIGGVDLYPGGLYRPSGIYHPSNYNLMLNPFIPPYTFDPVSREQMIRGINSKLPRAISSYSPSLNQTASSTVTRLTAQLDSSLLPQGARVGAYQWYVITPLNPTPTVVADFTAIYDFNSGFLGEGQTATVGVRVRDPDTNGYVRNESTQGELFAGKPLTWNFTRPGIPTTITAVSPPVGIAGDYILVYGTRLCPYNSCASTRVSINGGPAITPAYASNTLLTFWVPAGATTGQLTVTTATGGTVAGGTFTVSPISWISGFTPDQGAPGDRIAVYGRRFCPNTDCSATRVIFNPCAFTNCTNLPLTITPVYISDTLLTFIVPTNIGFNGSLTVSTTSGAGVTSERAFTISPSPLITAVIPANRGKAGDAIALRGLHFCSNGNCSITKVILGGFITPVYVSDTLLTFFIPPTTPIGTVPLSVFASGTGISSTVNFTVLAP